MAQEAPKPVTKPVTKEQLTNALWKWGPRGGRFRDLLPTIIQTPSADLLKCLLDINPKQNV